MLRRNLKQGFSLVELIEGLVAVGMLVSVAMLAIVFPAMRIAATPAASHRNEAEEDDVETVVSAIPTAAASKRPASAKPGARISAARAIAGLRSIERKFVLASHSVRGRPEVTDEDVANLIRLIKLGPAVAGANAIEKGELAIWNGFINVEAILLADTRISGAAIVELNQLSTLKELDLSGTAIGDHEFSQLATHLPLRILALSNTQISDAALSSVSRFDRLEQLYLSNTQVTGAGLASLLPLKRLAILEMNGTNIGDDGLVNIGKMSSLCELSLEHQPITDAGIANLARLNELDIVYLAGTRTSDASIPVLSRFYSLLELDLTDTQISESGVAQLRSTLRDCEIIK